MSFVAHNYDEDNIRVGKRRINGNTTYLIQVSDEHDNTLFIEMSRDNSYWNVNSAGIFRKGYSNKKETVAKTEPQQPNNAISSDSSLSDGKHNGIMPSEPNGESTVSSDGKVINNSSDLQVKSGKTSGGEEENALSAQISAASAGVNTEPTDGQKEAGNYKKGHVKVGSFDITIEQPAGSVRRGTDADGKQWESRMHNTYGYFRGTEGVDGDHIDVFLSNDIDGWDGRKVYVVDQYNPDGTFDEHKVMLGFNDMDEAKSDYLANYEKGREEGRRITVSATGLEDFEKWIGSSHRKTKPFSEYALVKKETVEAGVKTSSHEDGWREERTDGQGNPVNADGTLSLEKVRPVDELTDDDFSRPYRNVELPRIPENVDKAIGANGKPVVIKKNIFEKNWKSHRDLSPLQGREILADALYRPNMYGQNQKGTRPYNWILVHNAEKHSSVILEVNHGKDNVEIINWHYLDDKALKQKERLAVKEGGLILTLESAVGDTLNGLSSSAKLGRNSENGKVSGEKKESQSGKDDGKLRYQKAEDADAMAREYGVDAASLSRYAEGM